MLIYTVEYKTDDDELLLPYNTDSFTFLQFHHAKMVKESIEKKLQDECEYVFNKEYHSLLQRCFGEKKYRIQILRKEIIHDVSSTIDIINEFHVNI